MSKVGGANVIRADATRRGQDESPPGENKPLVAGEQA
jgi:hypothetical protein